ncbi:hypothetical protein MPER_05810, partial [Moniliophthora perniciosa FA553]
MSFDSSSGGSGLWKGVVGGGAKNDMRAAEQRITPWQEDSEASKLHHFTLYRIANTTADSVGRLFAISLSNTLFGLLRVRYYSSLIPKRGRSKRLVKESIV